MKANTRDQLRREFERFPFLRGVAASRDDLERAEDALDLKFGPEYRTFLEEFGGAMVGPYPVFGTSPVDAMGSRWSVVSVNREFHVDNWPGIEGWLIISVDHAGNPIGLTAEGRVKRSDHGTVEEIAESFDEFLGNFCVPG